MKKKYLQLLCLVFLSSCTDPGGDPTFEGFTFGFTNRTHKVYDARLYIGGFLNGGFIATDSIDINDLKTGSPDIHGNYFVEENRWKPSLDKIRAILSDSCYFKLKLSNTREEIIEDFDSSNYFSLDISDGKMNFVGRAGDILIKITDTKIEGYAFGK